MHGPGFAATQENMRIRNVLANTTNQSERRLPGDSDSLLYILRVSESLPYIYILLVGDCELLDSRVHARVPKQTVMRRAGTAPRRSISFVGRKQGIWKLEVDISSLINAISTLKNATSICLIYPRAPNGYRFLQSEMPSITSSSRAHAHATT
jgi:hypothetical protein